MSYTSATDPRFLGALRSWIREGREILLLIRYSRAAGARDFELFSSFDTLADRLRRLPAAASIIAFRRPQLSLRWVVDEAFIARCLSTISEGCEFLALETMPRRDGEYCRYHWMDGETHVQLRDRLRGLHGVGVAVGPYPPWLEDGDDVVSAVMPDSNGNIGPGVY